MNWDESKSAVPIFQPRGNDWLRGKNSSFFAHYGYAPSITSVMVRDSTYRAFITLVRPASSTAFIF
jgi:hypothetical protein